jgi:hypothetical protein
LAYGSFSLPADVLFVIISQKTVKQPKIIAFRGNGFLIFHAEISVLEFSMIPF